MIMCAYHHCSIDLCGCDADEQYRRAQAGPDEPNYKALYTELKEEVEEAREIAKRVPALEFELRAKVAELEIADGEIERLQALVIELRNALIPEGYNDLQGTTS